MSGLAVEREDAVARVWLDRPERRNAFNAELIAAVHEAFTSFAADETLRLQQFLGRHHRNGLHVEIGRAHV